MRRSLVLRVLCERCPAPATGLSWVPPVVLRALTWDRGIEHEDEMLQSVAAALDCDLAFVDASYPWAADAVRMLRAQGVVVAWAVAGVLGRVSDRRGMSDVIRASAVDPALLGDELDMALQGVLASVDQGCTAGAEVIVVADDLAGQSGWLVAPDYAMEALVPRYESAAIAATAAGAVPVFHSDGDVRVLYPALSSAGFAGVHLGGAGRLGVEAAMPAAVRNGLALLGGIQVSAIAHEGARHIGEGLAPLAHSGPLIICDDGGVSSPAEIAAMGSVLDAARHAWDQDTKEW